MKKSPKDCSQSGMQIQLKVKTNRPAERIPVTHAKLEGKSECACSMCECVCVCIEKQVPDQKICEEKHYNVQQKMQHWTLYREVFWSVPLKTELLEVKVTTEFQEALP
jgi:hypothetical protein